MTLIFQSIADWQQERAGLGGLSLGFVPTMGALHEGHASLLKRSREENDQTIISIFVNPTQFNQAEDLEKYPRTFAEDISLLNDLGVDYCLYPSYAELYPDNYRYHVEETQFSRHLCGASRPGHFKGVLTIVLKLLLLVQPQRAYFGEKDYQQLQLIKDMVEAFFVPTTIISCPTSRDPDGLAMSSRNRRLSEQARQKAPLLYKVLREESSLDKIKEILDRNGFAVDYLEEAYGRRFAAVYLEGVRLIDNIEFNV